MKPVVRLSPSQRVFAKNQGVALVIVLSLLVLITALVVGFLVRTGVERSASASYRANADARMLADTAVNFVQAQINEASSGTNTAWASQPGALRVYDDSGSLSKIYRLYSAVSPTATSGSSLGGDLPAAGQNWAGEPALWVDLNAPVKVSGTANNAGTPTSDYLVFPILDPRDPADPGPVTAPKITTKMPGFSVDTGNAPDATAQQPVPMPVRWLYVLRDGQIVAPGAPAGTSKSVAVAGATASNPIVGRVAFWTDDETSKVNVNTAAGSSGNWNGTGVAPAPWDIPRFRLNDERLLFSDNQPVHGEYQRYPGHPATTDLSGIFGALGIPKGGYPSTQTAAGTPSDFFRLLPKYDDSHGSKGGTQITVFNNKAATPVTPTIDRLYASTGELLFSPQRTQNPSLTGSAVTRQQVESGKFLLTAHSRAPETTLFGTPRISMWPIDSEYGVDPTPANVTKLASPFDRLIAFCATTGTGNSRNPYYWQRHDSTSPTKDWDLIPRNQALYGYLQNLTSRAIPGFGGVFSTKYASGERDQILTEIADYIRCTNMYDHSLQDPATGSPNPRFTPRFPSAGSGQVVPLKINNTRGLGRMHTISELGLQIICTADGNGKQPSQPQAASDWRSVSNLAVPSKAAADGSLVPDSSAAYPANETLATSFGGSKTALGPGQKRLQAMLLFEMDSPMFGFDPIQPDFRISIQGLDNIAVTDSSGSTKSPFPQTRTGAGAYYQNGTAITDPVLNRLDYTQRQGGYTGFQYFISRRENSNPFANLRVNGWSNPGAGSNGYHFISDPFTISTDTAGNGTMTIGGGTFTVQVQVKDKVNPSQWNTAQTFQVTFPATTVPVPDLIQQGLLTWNGSTSQWNGPQSKPADWWSFDNRIKWVTSAPSGNGALGAGCVIRNDPDTITPGQPVGGWTLTSATSVPLCLYKDANGNPPSKLPPSDVVRSLIAKAGDMRLVMAKDTVTADGASDMVKPAGYTDSAFKLAHNFVQYGGLSLVPGADLSGKLVPGASYAPYWVPKVPGDTAPLSYWDWDSGLPSSSDGAFANKPDEGNIASNNQHPYFWGETTGNMAYFPSYFTPNRIIPSAVMFGSLPTGVKEGVPWRTLLFRPDPDSVNHRHIGAQDPRDHLLLDLFNMPVVEPYAISEPFSTAGKINLNYQIVPFTYINRSTAIRAVLGSELIARIPLAAARQIPNSTQCFYKIPSGNFPTAGSSQPPGTPMARLPLNLDESNGTLRQFKDKFAAWNLFKSASEICDIYLVPKGYSWPGFDAVWYGSDFAMVGDNVRERPYADIYPRLTTKSNTFTIHYKVQVLKNPGLNQGTWDEAKGVVTGELRGATTIERYLDPNNNSIPDYATNPNAPTLDTFYQWRIVANNVFAP